MLKKTIMIGALLFLCLTGTVQGYAITRSEAVNWAKTQANNKTAYDVDGAYGYQCADFASAYINYLVYGDPYYWRNHGYSGYSTYNGNQYISLSYPSGWQRINNYSGFVPQAGDILCFGGAVYNPYGHVAVAIEGCTTTYYNAIDQSGNRQGPPIYSYRQNYFDNYVSFQGVIRPKFEPESLDLGADFYARIQNTASGMYVAGTQDNVCLQKSGDDDAVWWHFVKNSDSTYTVTSLTDGRCMDVSQASAASGANVLLAAGNGTNAQKWCISGERNAYMLRAVCTGCVLDLEGGKTKEGTNVQMHEANGTDAQLFTVEQHVIGKFSDEGADFYAKLHQTTYDRYVTNVGGNVLSKAESGTDAQIWHFIRQTDGSYSIISLLDSRYMDVDGAGTNSGVNVQMMTGNGTDAQKWFLYRVGETWCLSARCTACVMDIFDASTEDGANIQMYRYNKTSAQTLALEKIAQPNISFDAAGGTLTPVTARRLVGKPYEVLPEPEWAHHIFLGWYTEAGEQVTEETPVTIETDHTLYARWEALVPYTVSTVTKQDNGLYLTTSVHHVTSDCTIWVVGYQNGRLSFCAHTTDFQETVSAFLKTPPTDTLKIFLWNGTHTPLGPSETVDVK